MFPMFILLVSHVGILKYNEMFRYIEVPAQKKGGKKEHLSGELVVEGLEVNQINGNQSQAVVFLNWIAQVLNKTFEVSQQGRQ